MKIELEYSDGKETVKIKAEGLFIGTNFYVSNKKRDFLRRVVKISEGLGENATVRQKEYYPPEYLIKEKEKNAKQ